MRAALAADDRVNYRMVLGKQVVELNPLIGRQLTLNSSGHIDCQHCGKKSKKLCSRLFFALYAKLVQCDMCIYRYVYFYTNLLTLCFFINAPGVILEYMGVASYRLPTLLYIL
jgi:hypothetical protein